ncbi:FemAB family XrtA/PEP-CTERM system-associated protein [Marinobacter sp.]|uniref:FemAB family XrtA/PEP-CTERM system-associated protein n=1 Tax=Marinobacter sp. TaxID=50741 RepID=UPI0019966393|nr:FemAB family XrtA/PEP-CTERM system-associated protein [Marinobacter sp.]MBC7193121.1 FemAB family PEP-CTERM system-associated protein [Marinobacter sp.]
MDMQEATPAQTALRNRIEALKASKGRLSRQIGEARKSGDDCDPLIAELQGISAELKNLQKSLKKQLNEAAKPAQAWQPSEPVIPQAVLNQPESPFEIALLSDNPAAREAVQEYLRQHPAVSLWHTPEIPEFITDTCRHDHQYLVARGTDGQVMGVLPVVQQKSRLFGNFMVSVPYFNYGGILADNRMVAEALMARAGQWRAARGAAHVELRHIRDAFSQLPKRTDKVTWWLPLPQDAADLWSSFQPKVRAQVRRGEREISGIDVGGIELLDDFYKVFARNMRDLGTPVYGKGFFAGLLKTLGNRATLVVARMQGKPAGCAFLTGFGNRMEIPWASTLREHNHSGINMAMYWKVLQLAVAQGFELFDFGRCSRDAGTARFKQQWGAFMVPLHWHYCLPEGGELPGLNPDNPKFRVLIAVWKRLPVWVTRIMGPMIVRNLP